MSTDSHTYMSAKAARAAIKVRRRETLTGWDAWGRKHTWVIEWQAETCGNDAARDNVGEVGVVWADECPVGTKIRDGDVCLTAPPVAGAATWSCAHEPHRVRSAAAMGPGCWRIVDPQEERDSKRAYADGSYMVWGPTVKRAEV
jgi:hypothetical protein